MSDRSYKKFVGPRQRRRRERRKAKVAIIMVLILTLAVILSWTMPRQAEETASEELSDVDLQLLICNSRWSWWIAESNAEEYPEYASLFRKAFDTHDARNPLYGEPWELTSANIEWMAETAAGHPVLAERYAERYPTCAALFLAIAADEKEAANESICD